MGKPITNDSSPRSGQDRASDEDTENLRQEGEMMVSDSTTPVTKMAAEKLAWVQATSEEQKMMLNRTIDALAYFLIERMDGYGFFGEWRGEERKELIYSLVNLGGILTGVVKALIYFKPLD